MKILKAEFQNFKGLYSGLGKYEVVLDFKKMTNTINVIIGEMGSGKTTILSHLQPWATVGSLDERNTDGIIIEEMNGHKYLVFQNGADIYEITHSWKWEKDHHSLKSYFKKNGEELNPNGNQSSFKELVELEMGIDQSFLRLARLGPNVSNLIEMTATARKEFIAQMLTEVDLYLALFKSMNERSKVLTAQSQLLAKKFNGITEDTVASARESLKVLQDSIDDTNREVVNLNGSIGMILGECQALLGGKDLREYQDDIDSLCRQKDALYKKRNEMEIDIESISLKYSDISEIDKEIGKNETIIVNNQTSIDNLRIPKESAEARRDKLAKLKAASNNTAYVEQLTKTYAALCAQYEEYDKDLEGFDSDFTSSQINTLISDVQTFDSLINDVITRNSDSVRYIVKHANYDDALKASHRHIETLQNQKYKLQKSMNNLGYLGGYQATEELVLPSECKCHLACPYYTTHPNVIKSEVSNFVKKQKEISAEIQSIDVRIEQLLEYPLIIGMMRKLESFFPKLSEELKKIKALRVASLSDIILKNHKWYDYDVIAETLEKTVKKEKMYEIKIKLPELKAELDKYSSIDIGNLTADLDKAEDELRGITDAITEFEFDIQSRRHDLDELNELRKKMVDKDNLTKSVDDLSDKLITIEETIEQMRANTSTVISKTREMQSLKERARAFEHQLNNLRSDFNKLNAKIVDWENSTKEFDEIKNELTVINLVKEASSAKKGIPLIYVRIFLNDCIDVINDLISMVFGDAVEIKEFNITDKDFFIPYYKNGTLISDVKSASQGERSIISLALSFALIRKSITTYNILLLDEIDGALYSKDREKFLTILAQQIKAINAEQIFVISHNNTFEGMPVNIISTTPELIDKTNVPTIYV